MAKKKQKAGAAKNLVGIRLPLTITAPIAELIVRARAAGNKPTQVLDEAVQKYLASAES